MKLGEMKIHSYSFSFPTEETPAWSASVDRWYQLDPFSYGLVAGYHHWKQNLNSLPLSLVILGSAGASNETDRSFAKSGAVSPSKFVHTLPNVRVTPLLQSLNWTGPVLCLQNDPETLQQALREAMGFLGKKFPVIWILSVVREKIHYKARCLELLEMNGEVEIHQGDLSALSIVKEDLLFLKWLGEFRTIGEGFTIQDYELRKKESSRE